MTAVLIALLMLVSAPVYAQTASAECLGIPRYDQDHDGISDECEFALAKRFAPLLTFTRGTCNLTLPVPRPAGGYLFGVQRVNSRIRIAYLPAYVDDCGWEGFKCRLPTVDCRPHAGDSEFIVVELAPTGSGTVTVSGVFLSAHCFGRSRDDCRWYRDDDLKAFEWQNGAPVIWVGKGRHANYPSKRACDRGHHFLDTCDEAMVRSQFPVFRSRNIGSKQRPAFEGGCVTAEQVGLTTTDANAVECIWDPQARFKGWQSGVAGVTGYFRYLTEIAGF
jgi:hypothetical protein